MGVQSGGAGFARCRPMAGKLPHDFRFFPGLPKLRQFVAAIWRAPGIGDVARGFGNGVASRRGADWSWLTSGLFRRWRGQPLMTPLFLFSPFPCAKRWGVSLAPGPASVLVRTPGGRTFVSPRLEASRGDARSFLILNFSVVRFSAGMRTNLFGFVRDAGAANRGDL